VAESRRYLAREYPSKIRIALDALPEGDLWWRPNEASNSIGNLLLHLAGNIRQWMVHGLGGAPDARDRAAEFRRGDGMSKGEAFAALMSSVTDADQVLSELDPDTLLAPRTIQGLETTGLAAIYHVVEHFSMHTGQILYLVKLRTGNDLGFYSVDEGGDVTGTHW
jgi:uncharacterized damage-inducible protein DinB